MISNLIERADMTLEEFRKKHSELIENYQFIEMWLEGIYAGFNKGDFVENLQDVATTNMHRLLVVISKLEEKNHCEILSAEEKDAIAAAIRERNFWVHNCYTDLVFKRTGELKRTSDIGRLQKALQESEDLRNTLFEKQKNLVDAKLKESLESN